MITRLRDFSIGKCCMILNACCSLPPPMAIICQVLGILCVFILLNWKSPVTIISVLRNGLRINGWSLSLPEIISFVLLFKSPIGELCVVTASLGGFLFVVEITGSLRLSVSIIGMLCIKEASLLDSINCSTGMVDIDSGSRRAAVPKHFGLRTPLAVLYFSRTPLRPGQY